MNKWRVLLAIVFLLPILSFATPAKAALTDTQIQAVVGLLQSFGVDPATIASAEAAMRGQATPAAPQTPSTGQGSSAGSACAINLTRSLDVGATGSDVTALQQTLVSLGYLTATPTGYYGTLTAEAVAKFQTAHGLEAIGGVGPKTRAALASLVCSTNPSTPPPPSTTPPPSNSPSTNPTPTSGGTPSTIQNYTPPPAGGGGGGGGGAGGGGGNPPSTVPAPTLTFSSSVPSVTSGGAVTLTWSTTNASTCSASGSWSGTQSTGGSQTLTNLTTSQTYTLTCTGAGGTANQSVTVTVTSTTPPPDTTPPTISNAAPSGTLPAGTVNTALTLTTSEAATCRYATTNSAFASMTLFPTTGGTSHTAALTGLTNGTAYTYYTACKDTAGNVSSPNTLISFSVAAPATPAPTVTITANPTSVTFGNSSTVTWSSTNATACTASGGWSGAKAISGTQAFTNLTTNQTFTLQCSGAGGSATQSANVTVTGSAPDTTSPSAPSGLSGSATSQTQINLTWTVSTDNVGVTGYQVFRNGATTPIASPTTNSYSDTGLTASTLYSYTVKAKDAAGNASAASNSINVTTQSPPPPVDTTPPTVTITAPATNLAANTTQTTLSATTNEAASCRYSTTSTFTFSTGTLFTTTGNLSHSTTLTGLQNSTSYTYNVKCQDTAGNIDPTSASVTFSVATPPDIQAPSVPAGLSATAISSSQINLSWTASTDNVGVTGYQVFRNGATTPIASPATNSYSDTGLTASTLYSYTVKAKDAAGNVSGASTAASATTQAAGGGGGTLGNANGLRGTDPTFFPIAVWLQTPESNAVNYKNIGVNLFDGLYNGSTASAFTALQSAGLGVIVQDQSQALALANSSVVKAWLQQDEPDNAQANASGGYDPCIAPATIVAQYNAFKASDSSRPVVIDFGQGVANINWGGRGTCTGNTSMYPQYAQGADILGFDVYPINDGYPITYVADGVDNLKTWGGGKPVWADIENTQMASTNPKPTTAQVKTEVWLALTHGATGIVYFAHIFSPTFIEAGLLSDSAMSTAVANINTEIKNLASVLNSPTIANGATVTSGSRIDKMVKQSGGFTYLFAVSPNAVTASATFNVSGLGNGTVTVIDESRTLTMTNGSFTDTFAAYGVHLYQIGTTVTPPPDTTPPSTPTGLAATVVSSSQINLTWTASTDNVGVTGYQIWRGATQVGTSATNSYSDTGLTAATLYSYTVKATDAAGNASAASTAATATTLTAPAGFINGDRIQVSSGPLNVRATANTAGTLLGTQATGAFGTIIGGPTIQGGFTWWNINYDTGVDGWSAQDFLVKVNPIPTASVSAAPTSVTSGNSSALTWTSTNATGCTASGGWSGAKAISGTQTLSNLTATATYTLTCSGTGGTSPAASATVTVTTASDTTAPSVPTGLSATAISSSQINLSWTASTDNVGVTGYKIFRAGTQVGTSATNSYSDSGLNASTAYSYTVSAYDAVPNNSAQSASASATTGAVQTGGTCPRGSAYADGCATAPSASTQHATLLSGYAVRPPWNVAGVDYGVGIPAGTVLKNPTTAGALPACASLSPSNHLMYIASNCTIDGFDFTLGGGWQGYVTNGASNVVIKNSNFLRSGVYADPTSSNFTFSHNTIDYSGDTTSSSLLTVSGNGATLIEYNWMKNTPQHFVEFNGNSGAQNVTYRYNMLEEGGLGAGSHLNYSQFQGAGFPNTKILFNTMLQHKQAAGGEGFQLYDTATPEMQNSELGNNTMVTIPGGTCVLTGDTSGCAESYMVNGGSGTGNIHDNYMDPRGAFGPFYPGQNGFTRTNNIDLNNGKTINADNSESGGSSDTTAPSIPTGLSASAVSSSQINLTWTASTDNVAVSGYKIFRAGSQVGTSATNSYSDTGLTASTAYSYTVSAYDAAGNNSAQSSSASATTQAGAADTTPPTIAISAPSGQLAAGTTQTTLSLTTNETATCGWSNTAGTAFASMTTFSTTGGTSHSTTISGLTNGTSYTAYVKCKDTAGNISADSSTSYSVASAGGGGGGPVTYVSDADNINPGGTTSDTFTSFAVSGTNPVIMVTAALNSSTGNISSIALSAGLTGGTPYLCKQQRFGTTDLEVWAIPAPSGSGTITVNYSVSADHQSNAALFQGANQTTPCSGADAAATTGATTPLSVTPSNVTANDVVVYAGAQTVTGDAPHATTGTEIFFGNSSAANLTVGYRAGPGAVTVTWGVTAPAEAVVGVRVHP